jgi:hypothetical protein
VAQTRHQEPNLLVALTDSRVQVVGADGGAAFAVQRNHLRAEYSKAQPKNRC